MLFRSQSKSTTILKCRNGCTLRSTFFFVRFINGLVERYPELFEGDGHASQHAANFAKKWSSYSTINELANGDILKFNEVTEQPLEKCLLHLAYKADKAQVEGLMHKEMMKRVTP